jgi:hypothetical protein
VNVIGRRGVAILDGHCCDIDPSFVGLEMLDDISVD